MADHTIGSNFNLVRKLGSGPFGEIFQGLNLKTNQEIAMKFEHSNTKHPQLFYETKLYRYLQTDPSSIDKGIPQVHDYITEEKHNIMVMDLLGPSLEDLFNACNRKFSLKTVLMLGEQMLESIEFIHSKLILHRDIAPENFVIGRGKMQHKVFIIDFGLAKKYQDRDGKHIPYREGKRFTGGRNASINAHLGIEQGRRDDLECLGYVLLYFLRGGLPWQNLRTKTKKEKYQKIMEKKLGTPAEILCKGSPSEFLAYMVYCRNLKFEDKPDYAYLRSLFKDLFAKLGYEWDYEYDWTIIANKKNQEKKSSSVSEGNKKEENKMKEELEGSKNPDPTSGQQLNDKNMAGTKEEKPL